MLWLDPMPVEEDLPFAYETYYTHGESPHSTFHRIGALLYRCVTDSVLSVAGIPQAQARLRRMFLGAGEGRKLLDIGCGSGAFVSRMRRRGWDACGIDVDPAAVAAGRSRYGVDVQQGVAADLVAQGKKFAVVTANHVIEHVSDPVQFLVQCRNLLNGAGRVILVTPNAGSFGHQRFAAHWYGLDVPRHLWVFTPRSLKECARRAGLVDCTLFTSSANAASIAGASRTSERYGRFEPRGLSPVPPGRCVCIAPVATHNVRAPEDRPNRAIPMRVEVHGPGSCGSRGHALGASARAKASPGESRFKGRATNAFRRGDRGLAVRRRCIGPALFQITATKDSPLEL